MTLHVVIPFYNESETLLQSVARVLASPLPEGWSRHVVLIDDHSDAQSQAASRALAADLEARGAACTLYRHEVNRGKGAALQTGFDLVLGGAPPDDDLVVIHDADLEYHPADFGRLMEPLLAGTADAVIGSRWREARLEGLKRRLHAAANGFLSVLSNVVSGYRLTDMECCYKMMPVGLLRRLRPRLTENRYGIEPQIVAALAAAGARVAEVPVRYDPRSIKEGKKIRWTDGMWAMYVIARERLRRPRG